MIASRWWTDAELASHRVPPAVARWKLVRLYGELRELSPRFVDILEGLQHKEIPRDLAQYELMRCTSGTPSGRASSFRVDLPYFHGTINENFCAWYSVVEDQLQAAQIPHENWPVTISSLFRENAQTWYLARKQANNGKPLTANELYTQLKAEFDSPTRVDDIRQALSTVPY
ncbi:hypothetical protein B0H14DRAFT_2596551 [Mycena olivaceomarginata]|nr:hypothetical protein B0H14DRAFT_2596551 [Mycena olivaceomarginata]